MMITSSLFEAFLRCPTKCWLRATNESPTGNTYAEWVQLQNESFRATEAERLLAETPPSESARSPAPENLKVGKLRLAVDVVAQTPDLRPHSSVPQPSTSKSQPIDQSLVTSAATVPGVAPPPTLIAESHLHAVERVPSEGRGKAAQFIPIRCIFFNKLTKDDKLLLAFDAFVLSTALGREIAVGKIIHGDDHATLKVKTSALAGEVRKRLEKIAALLSSPTPPDLVLNRRCGECEFQDRCRKIAVEKDDLSLLAGMSAKERQKLRSKGIFTVTQLSYTFRPRRTPKRAKNPAKPRYLALQALAIRENTVYIHGTPIIPQPKTEVYLDIEGLPDQDSYYLVGALVVTDRHASLHSFWADTASDEATIFAQLAETISQLDDFRVFHFGNYDTTALKRMRPRLSDSHQRRLDMVLAKCTNVLSIVFPHVYFPTYSNNLKDIDRHLTADLSTEDATGLKSVIWRMQWERHKDPDLKIKLLNYNAMDTLALKRLTEFLRRRTELTGSSEEGGTKVSRTEEIKPAHSRWRMFARKAYLLENVKRVVECSYFDYQREKVFVRTHRQFKKINREHRRPKCQNLHPNKTIEILSTMCPFCGSRRIWQDRQKSHVLLDLKFSRTGVKRWMIKVLSWRYECQKCLRKFASEERAPNPQKYGPGILSWCAYFTSVCGQNLLAVRRSLEDMFGISIPAMCRLKEYLTARYERLYSELLPRILESPVLHVDETSVHLLKQTGYVWVVTTLDMVYFFYRPSREGEFLTEPLAPFSGVLISDFYTAYDSLPCQQQKCLLHLVRDLDDDLVHNPFNDQFKALAQGFGALLRPIIETIDCFGLKRRHLAKHKREVERFLMKSVDALTPDSELVEKYRNRFIKYWPKMFTFLDYDGVPWNNNNAEHAIGRFAKYRRNSDGRYSERSLKEYLVLASVLETCDFNKINVLKFLLSNETTLEGLMRMAGRQTPKSVGLLAPKAV